MSIEHKGVNLQVDLEGHTNLSEETIAQSIASPTGTSWEDVFKCVLLPKKVSGLKILDVGGGGSDATCELLERGAEAYSIDPAYRNMKSLVNNLEIGNAFLDSETREIRARVLDRFIQSTRENPGSYIEGLASMIPFSDGYFDVVFSRIAVLFYLDVDSKILEQSVDEMLRATNSGGTIRLFPFMDEEPTWQGEVNDLRIRNNEMLLENLKRNSEVKQVYVNDASKTLGDWKTLVIKKN